MIKLWKEEIIYDVRYNLFLRESTLPEKADDYIARQIQTAVSDACQEVGWAVDTHSRMHTDEIDEIPKEYNVGFRFDDGWVGSPQHLVDDFHNVVVNSILADYLLAKKDETAAAYVTKKQDYIQKIKKEVNLYDVDKPMFIL